MTDLISDGSKERRILEPSAGKGIFLEILVKMGYRNLSGIEIDPLIANQSAFSLHVGNFFDFPITEKFDIVIGNPPYVRWKNLSPDQRQYLSSSSFWHKRMSGLTDILQPFIFKSVDHLKPGGELIFITPMFWMQTLHAEPLRRFLLDNGSIEIVINFHESRIFPKVNLNLIIIKYRKSKQDQFLKVINYWQKGQLKAEIIRHIRRLILESSSWNQNSQNEGNLEFFETHQPLNSQPWRLLPLNVEEELAKFEESCYFSPDLNINGLNVRLSNIYSADDLKVLDYPKTSCKELKLDKKTYFIAPQKVQLTKFISKGKKERFFPPPRSIKVGDVVEIGNGMVSGLDKAFRLKANLHLTDKEVQLIIPVVKAKAVRRYYAKFLTDYFLIRPGVIQSEKILKRDFPSLYKQLEPFKNALENRYQYNREIPYWEWVFIRNYNLMKEADSLICVPCKDRFDKRGHLRFALCKQGIFATQDVTVLVKLSWVKESSEYISAFLNSKEVFNWVINKGLIRGGVAEFSEEPLKNIPFRLINWESSTERQIHQEVKSLVQKIQQNKVEDENKVSKVNSLISQLLRQ